ncbi:MAG: TIGR03032 family protein [Rhodospirillales bacterium]|nr:TIGR03032 family protein [Rhodospirillales bacterium]MCB9996066.1 TIGR03032 family protein [Rhodospirillales bacterium]
MIRRVGDTPDNEAEIVGRFDLHINDTFIPYLAQENMSVALTTYEGGKLIVVGPGQTGATVAERNFQRCMALHVEDDRNIWISTHHNIWKLENGVPPGEVWHGQWDRMYLPRTAYVTGGVDVHEIIKAGDGHMYGVVTGYNCVARIGDDEKGSFTPYWRPPFIDGIVFQDRCHLNGLCLEEGELAYVSMVSQCNIAGQWREDRDSGGVLMDMRTNDIVASGLCMPHTPRLYNGELWFLEAGKGYLCKADLRTGKVERALWLPGFLRGLHFYKNYAFICCSAPRDKDFQGLPLDKEFEERGQQPKCALEMVNMDTMTVETAMSITGSVKEIYDVALLENCRQPLIYGIFGDDIKNIVVTGEDESAMGALNDRVAVPAAAKVH